MKYIKSYENNILDGILDKISSSGIDTLTKNEKEFLDKHSKNQSTKEIEKDLDSKTFVDNIGQYEAKIKLTNIEHISQGDEEYDRWDGKLYIDNKEYEGYIIFQNNDYINCFFYNDDSDIYTDFEGLEHEIDSFCSWAFYGLIDDLSKINENLLLENRIDDIENKFQKKLNLKL